MPTANNFNNSISLFITLQPNILHKFSEVYNHAIHLQLDKTTNLNAYLWKTKI